MLNSLKTITDKVKQLYDQHNEILDYLFQHCWEDIRPLEIEEKEGGIDLDFMISPRPEEKKLSESMKTTSKKSYQQIICHRTRNISLLIRSNTKHQF
jgi:hypothetical protein